MKLFGWRREASRPALSRAGATSIGEWPPSYEAQVRAGYAGNAIAQRAVRLVAEGLAGATAAGRVEPGLPGGAREVRVSITVNARAGEGADAMRQSGRQVARAVRAALQE